MLLPDPTCDMKSQERLFRVKYATQHICDETDCIASRIPFEFSATRDFYKADKRRPVVLLLQSLWTGNGRQVRSSKRPCSLPSMEW